MIKTTYYRYECRTCGYIICQSFDAGDIECSACKNERTYMKGDGNFTVQRLQEEIDELWGVMNVCRKIAKSNS